MPESADGGPALRSLRCEEVCIYEESRTVHRHSFHTSLGLGNANKIVLVPRVICSTQCEMTHFPSSSIYRTITTPHVNSSSLVKNGNVRLHDVDRIYAHFHFCGPF